MTGLVLPGGGALCAWQAGCLEALVKNGFKFDKVLGISGGALTGAAYFAGRLLEEMHHWRDADGIRALRLSPRWTPLSLFRSEPVWDLVAYALDEARMRAEAICDFTVVTLRRRDRTTLYSRFTPQGRPHWDGPLAARLVASASIPKIYPPVSIGGEAFQDGGSDGTRPLSFDALKECRDIFVLQPVRPEEGGRAFWNPLTRYDQPGRETTLKQMAQGARSLSGLPVPPRITTITPSRTLAYGMLEFTTRRCGPAVAQGVADGEAFARRASKSYSSALTAA